MALTMRPKKTRSACWTTGSVAAIIDAIAQMGLESETSLRPSHTKVVPTKTLSANRTPSRSSARKRSERLIAGIGRSAPLRTSLVGMRRVTLEPVDGPCLGRAHRDPVADVLLESAKELLASPHRLLVKLLLTLELELEGKFSNQGAMGTWRAPAGDIGLSGDALAEVEDTEILQHLLDDHVVHELHPLALGATQGGERGEHFGQAIPRRPIRHVDLAQAELDVVRVEQPEASDRVFEGQRLGFELDAESSGDFGPHVYLGRFLQLRMSELEYDFGIADGESVFVGETQAEDEGVVVEAEALGVEEENLTDPDAPLLQLLGVEPDPVLFRGPGDLVTELEKALRRDDSIRPEDNLALQILNRVEGMTVAVLARLRLGKPTRIRQLLVFSHMVLQCRARNPLSARLSARPREASSETDATLCGHYARQRRNTTGVFFWTRNVVAEPIFAASQNVSRAVRWSRMERGTALVTSSCSLRPRRTCDAWLGISRARRLSNTPHPRSRQ